MSDQISQNRKTLFYLGTGLMILGGLLFASTFLSAVMNFGNFDDFTNQGRSMGIRAFGGMGLMILGGMIRTLGARGLAGSGMVLDPKKARSELEPYSRMVGGMAKDVLEEADIDLSGKPDRVVMIKCRACNHLNEEDSKFCQECGQAI